MKIPVLFHWFKYRGDRDSAERIILMLSPNTTLEELKAIVDDEAGGQGARLEILGTGPDDG